MDLRRGVVALLFVVLAALAACGGDGDGDGVEGAATNEPAADCTEIWVEVLNGVDAGEIDADFEFETSDAVADAQEQCPFDELSTTEQTQVFVQIDADVRQALMDAGVIEFEPIGEPVE